LSAILYGVQSKLAAEYVAESHEEKNAEKSLPINIAVSRQCPLHNLAVSQNTPLNMLRSVKSRHQLIERQVIGNSGESNTKTLRGSILS
jgi:hypothetical protein